jgi:hypothetical protein
VNEDGSCVNGHGPEHVSRVYDTDTQNAPPPPVPLQPEYPQAPPIAPGSYGAPYGAPPPQGEGKKATVSLVFGIASILCCFPFITIPAGIAAVVFGVQGLNTEKRGLAIAGIVLGALGIVGGLINAVLGAFFGLQDPALIDSFLEGVQ